MKTIAAQLHDLAVAFCAARSHQKLTPQLVELAMLEAATLAYRVARRQGNDDRRKANLPN